MAKKSNKKDNNIPEGVKDIIRLNQRRMADDKPLNEVHPELVFFPALSAAEGTVSGFSNLTEGMKNGNRDQVKQAAVDLALGFVPAASVYAVGSARNMARNARAAREARDRFYLDEISEENFYNSLQNPRKAYSYNAEIDGSNIAGGSEFTIGRASRLNNGRRDILELDFNPYPARPLDSRYDPGQARFWGYQKRDGIGNGDKGSVPYTEGEAALGNPNPRVEYGGSDAALFSDVPLERASGYEYNPLTGTWGRVIYVDSKKDGGSINALASEDEDDVSDVELSPSRKKWTVDDEDDFRDWYSQISASLNINPDPDAPDQYYDYRSFWKENPEEAQKMLDADEGSHFTDKYKLPGHPTFSEESIYSTEETPGGKWAEHDGTYYYIPSEYTRKYLDRTREYLAGSNEGIELDGKYELIPPMRQGGGMEGCGFCRAWQAARVSGEPSFSWNGHTFHTEEKRHGGALLEGTGDIWSTSSDVIRMFGDGGLVERQDHVFDRLVNEYKIPPIQAAAIVANLTAESGLDPMAEGDSGQSVGIQQWKGPRRKELEKMSKSGVDIPGLDAQVDFLMKEYNRNAFQFDTTGQNLYASGKTNNSIFDYYQYSKADFDNAKNLWDATIAWNQGVGRPNKKFAANERRFKIAQEIADRHGIKYDENSHYEMMGPTSLPTLEVFAESSKEKMFPSNQPASAEEQSKMDEFMSHISDMLADYNAPKQDINVYISNSGNADQQLKADGVLTRKRLAEQEQREKEKRFLEAVLPEIQLHIPGMAK